MFLSAALKVQWVGMGEGRDMDLFCVQDVLSKGTNVEMSMAEKRFLDTLLAKRRGQESRYKKSGNLGSSLGPVAF